MCFSAPASFIGGAVLTGIGTLTFLTNRDPSKRFFAAIPLVFGVQQVAEGVVWLTLPTAGTTPEHDLIHRLAVAAFLIAAVILWPTLVPLSVLRMEKKRPRRIALAVTLGIGVLVSLAHVVGMFVFDVRAEAFGFHIRYSMSAPHPLAIVTMIGYLAATILPFFFSSVKRVPAFGAVIVLSYLVAEIFYTEYLVSVWCFFAAVASAVIWWVLRVPQEAAALARAAAEADAEADEDEAKRAKA